MLITQNKEDKIQHVYTNVGPIQPPCGFNVCGDVTCMDYALQVSSRVDDIGTNICIHMLDFIFFIVSY